MLGAVACGGSGKRASAVPTLSSNAVAPPSGAGTSVVLYRGGAWVQVRRNVEVPVGRSTIEVEVPDSLDIENLMVLGTGTSTLVSTSMLTAEAKFRVRMMQIMGGDAADYSAAITDDGTISFDGPTELPKVENSKVLITPLAGRWW